MNSDSNMNPQYEGNAGTQQFLEGTPVYDSTGDKVGTVSAHNVEGNYLVIQKGWLFPHDVYVPLTAVARNDADGVYLDMTKDQALNQDWQNPPTATTADQRIQQDMSGVAQTARTSKMDTRGATGLNTGTNVTNDTPIDMSVSEEQLIAGKRQEEIGRVHMHKEVIEQPETVSATVHHEEVHIERVPVDERTAANIGSDAFTERDIDVPVMGEELVVGKQARVTEEVRLSKQDVTEQRQATDTVRKERLEIDGVDEQGHLLNPNDPNYTTHDRSVNP